MERTQETTKCNHGTVRNIGPDRAFSGPVSVEDENRAAHGGIVTTEECSSCGARREVAINGWHREEGPWGPSRAERLEVARRFRREAEDLARRAREAGTDVVCSDGRRLHLTIDADGYIVADGDRHTEQEAVEAARKWPGGVAVAAELRAARALAEQAAQEV